MDGRIPRRSITSSRQSAATSKIVERCFPRVNSCKQRYKLTIAFRPLPLLSAFLSVCPLCVSQSICLLLNLSITMPICLRPYIHLFVLYLVTADPVCLKWRQTTVTWVREYIASRTATGTTSCDFSEIINNDPSLKPHFISSTTGNVQSGPKVYTKLIKYIWQQTPYFCYLFESDIFCVICYRDAPIRE